jgi:hypothetical protein
MLSAGKTYRKMLRQGCRKPRSAIWLLDENPETLSLSKAIRRPGKAGRRYEDVLHGETPQA